MTKGHHGTARVGVDIGGTFTDVAIEAAGRAWSLKLPTTPEAPQQAVMEGIKLALSRGGLAMSDVAVILHGTTLATNALIERRGARTAFVTTAGFRDVLETGNEGRFDQYDTRATKPQPVVPRRLRLGVRERIRADGSVVEPLNLEDVRQIAQILAAERIEAVAIGFLHAYCDGSHERAAGELLAASLPDATICMSHEVTPEMREYERFSTTCANAYIRPLMSRYLNNLRRDLDIEGFGGPLLLMQSSGSLTSVDIATRFPIRLLESGPAGGAAYACSVARTLGLDEVLSLDVGGTTAKFCLIDAGRPKTSLSFEIARTYRFKKGSGLPVRLPVVELVEIGAGGGSLAKLDVLGRLQVGPESAGAMPGPACYQRGGTEATVTDCDLLLGKLDAESFAGGTMPLSRVAAREAVTRLAEETGLTAEDVAQGVSEVVDESMALAARVYASEVGADLGRRSVVAFGGAAPLHAVRFAQKVGAKEVIVPPGAGVGSAIGFLRAPIAFEIVRTFAAKLSSLPQHRVQEILNEMRETAEAAVREAVPSDTAVVVRSSAYMRYVGQGHEIEVPFDLTNDADWRRPLREAFESAYAMIYGRTMARAEVETTSWAIIASSPHPVAGPLPEEPPEAAGSSVRLLYDPDRAEFCTATVVSRSALQPDRPAHGPLVITESQTTTIVPTGAAVELTTLGCLRIRFNEGPAHEH